MMFVVILAVIIFIGISLLIFIRFDERRFSEKNKQFFQKHWDEITGTMDKDPKKAILDADTLLDWVLKKYGYTGSLGEKLKKSEKLFSNIDAIWKAHKLRNRIVHEIDLQVNVADAKQTIKAFGTAFHDLGL